MGISKMRKYVPKAIAIVMIIMMVSVFIVLFHPVPTTELEGIYQELRAKTVGNSAIAIGQAGVDPITDVMVPHIGQDSRAVFFILSPSDLCNITAETIRYSATPTVIVKETNIERHDLGYGWSSYLFTVDYITHEREVAQFTVFASGTDGYENSRLYLVTPM